MAGCIPEIRLFYKFTILMLGDVKMRNTCIEIIGVLRTGSRCLCLLTIREKQNYGRALGPGIFF